MTVIDKYLPQLNSGYFRVVNRIYTNLGIKPRKDFQLLQKKCGTDVFEFATTNKCKIPSEAVTYTYVNIGKKSDLEYKNEIFSFFDKNGRIVTRYFRKGGENTELHSYKYNDNKRIIEKSIFEPSNSGDGSVKSDTDVVGKWLKQSTEYQTIHKFMRDLVKKGKQASLVLSKIIQHNPQDANVERITFTRYPINLGFESKTKKQVVSGTITHMSQDVKLSEVAHSENVDIDLRDEFLKFRFIDPRSDEGMRCMTHKFLKDRNLDDMGIFISPSSCKVPKNSLGYFSEWDRTICFSPKIKSGTTISAVQTSAHEVEHAYQHSLIGRIGRGYTRYETKALQKFGFPDKSERNLAVKYAMARDDYPKLSDTEDLSKNILYMNNLLEVDARSAGKAAEEKYRQYRSNFEFFDQFY